MHTSQDQWAPFSGTTFRSSPSAKRARRRQIVFVGRETISAKTLEETKTSRRRVRAQKQPTGAVRASPTHARVGDRAAVSAPSPLIFRSARGTTSSREASWAPPGSSSSSGGNQQPVGEGAHGHHRRATGYGFNPFASRANSRRRKGSGGGGPETTAFVRPQAARVPPGGPPGIVDSVPPPPPPPPRLAQSSA